MDNTIRSIIAIFMIALFLGCNKECKPRLLVVKHPIKVYKTYKEDAMEHVFTLEPGDKCAIGGEVTEKVFSYLEVVCSSKGHGWIIKTSDYVIIDESNAKNIGRVR